MPERAAALDLHHLRTALEARFGPAILPQRIRSARDVFATGVAVLDGLLRGGVPRAALSVWTGTGTAGRTAALRALVHHTCVSGGCVALVDSGLTLDAAFGCTSQGPLAGLWTVRPPTPADGASAAWAADALLRAGVFGLVIVDGAFPTGEQAAQLRKQARNADAALVISANRAEAGGLDSIRPDVRVEFGGGPVYGSGLLPCGRVRRRVRVRVLGAGIGEREQELELVHDPTDRLRAHPVAADRRSGER
ncbi:MAG: hypothetical protein M3418_12100 [Gemmatimonadota bacterium]|nr:hypothetical protein [Gemmatimonadota bacterium]